MRHPDPIPIVAILHCHPLPLQVDEQPQLIVADAALFLRFLPQFGPGCFGFAVEDDAVRADLAVVFADAVVVVRAVGVVVAADHTGSLGR